MIITGEQSGDLHGANLIHELQQIAPGVKVCGIGGGQLQQAGADLFFNIAQLGIVGAWEVLSHIQVIWQAFSRARCRLLEQPPDLLILVDFPDFNLRLAKIAKRKNIKVLYYISPQVWAWRKGRIYTIAKVVDMMAVILPFEKALYESVGLKVEFVGHPLVGKVQPKLSRDEAFRHFALNPARPVVALLPGSRHNEINYLLDVLLEAARLIASKFPAVQFILPLASSVDNEAVRARITNSSLAITIAAGETYDALSISTLAITASGTVTLEAAILGTPMIVIYRLGWLNYILGRILIDVDFISLANIVAQKPIVPELLQAEANPENIARQALDLLSHPEQLESMRRELGQVKQKLGEADTSRRVAQIALQMLEA